MLPAGHNAVFTVNGTKTSATLTWRPNAAAVRAAPYNIVFTATNALSGRDTTGVQKTISGLLKLLHPNPQAEISDEDLEWAIRLALECRRRVKEQQKRILRFKRSGSEQ